MLVFRVCKFYNDCMFCEIHLKPRAIKDLSRMQKTDATRIADALERLKGGLNGDIGIIC